MAKVPVELPEGMDPAKFQQLFGTWQKQRVEGQTKGKATTAAMKRLKDAHTEDYNRFYEEELAKAKKDLVS